MPKRNVMKEDPELTANQLAAYLRASAQRQETILRSAKYQTYDTTAKRIRYKSARTAIARCLASNRSDLKPVFEEKAKITRFLENVESAKEHASDFKINDAKLTIEALDAFVGSLNALPFSQFRFELGQHRPPKIDIEGVAISVRPDLVVLGHNREHEPRAGGLLMYFSKSVDESRLGERKEFGVTASTLVYRYAEEHLANKAPGDRRLCFSLDVFAQRAHAAPNSYKRREANIEAACRSISRQWTLIDPPDSWPQ